MTFCNAVRLGMLNWGTLMSPKGLTLLIASTAVWIAELAFATSFWIPVRILLKVFSMKLLSYRAMSM